MKLQVASSWYQCESFPDDVTLITEHHVSPDLRCNIWHLRGRQFDALIDSGLGLVSLRDTVAGLAGRNVMAIASHTHFDHIGCHHEFEQRLCHPAEADVLRGPDAHNTVWQAYQTTLNDQHVITALPAADFTFDDYSVVPAPPTRLIDEGELVDLGNRVLKVFHMPGHSPGSVCLYEKTTSTLYAGDVLYDGELLDSLYHSDRDRYRETLARLKEIPAEVFHCGHYPSFGRQRMHELVDAYASDRARRPLFES